VEDGDYPFLCPLAMSAPYSSSIELIVPVSMEPTMDGKKKTFESAFTSVVADHEDNDIATNAGHVGLTASYWPNVAVRRSAVQNDVAFVAGSIRFTSSDGVLEAWCEATRVNRLTSASLPGILSLASLLVL
jgi:hypothetical protein